MAMKRTKRGATVTGRARSQTRMKANRGAVPESERGKTVAAPPPDAPDTERELVPASIVILQELQQPTPPPDLYELRGPTVPAPPATRRDLPSLLRDKLFDDDLEPETIEEPPPASRRSQALELAAAIHARPATIVPPPPECAEDLASPPPELETDPSDTVPPLSHERTRTAPPRDATERPSDHTLDAAAALFVPSYLEIDEQRASPRIAVEVELHVSSESHFFSGLSGDISEGGVFVTTYRELPLGSSVDLEFTLPGSPLRVHASGIVRWHRDASPGMSPGVGIAFDDLSSIDRAAIERFCTTRPPLYYDDVG